MAKKKTKILGMEMDFSMKGFRKFAKSTRKGMSAAYGSSRKRERR